MQQKRKKKEQVRGSVLVNTVADQPDECMTVVKIEDIAYIYEDRMAMVQWNAAAMRWDETGEFQATYGIIYAGSDRSRKYVKIPKETFDRLQDEARKEWPGFVKVNDGGDVANVAMISSIYGPGKCEAMGVKLWDGGASHLHIEKKYLPDVMEAFAFAY